jgi:predicted GNAT family acetyltransferase
MSDIGTSGFDPFDNMAVDRAVGGLEEDPGEAARSIELGEKTGANPSAIHADLESFENNVKAATTAQLIRGNRHISDFINSHPLAGIVSNGDLHNLHNASEKMKVLPKGRSAVEYDFGETAGSLAAQWGQDFFDALWDSGKSLASIPKDITEHTIPNDEVRIAADNIRKEGVDFHNVSTFLGTLNNLFVTQLASGDPLNPQASFKPVNLGAQDLVGGLFGAFGTVTGLTPSVKLLAKMGENASGLPAEFSEQVAMLGMMFMGLKAGKSHVKGGEIPPPGLSKETDAIREHRSKDNLKALDEATKEIQSTQTNQLTPSLANDFAKQHVEDRSVYVSVDAVRKLYGDKPPTPEEGLLGWVDGLGDQIAAHAETGGDVAIPLKDWLTKVDPEVAKVLHDDIRVTKDDVTVNEAKRYKELLEPQLEDRGEGSYMVKLGGEGGDILSLKNTGEALQVGMASVGKEVRGQGRAVAMYERALQQADELGLPLRSDFSVSKDAIRVYEGLKRRGYDVTEAPDTITTKAGKTNVGAKHVFEVKGKGKTPTTSSAAGGPDLTRRGFLKGAGATVATTATAKVPKLEEPNPFAGADLSMFQKNVEHTAAEYWDFFNPGGDRGKDEAFRNMVKNQLVKGAKHFEGQGGHPSVKLMQEAARLIESGWTPSQEALLKTRKIGAGEGIEPSEMTKKMVEDDHMRPSEASEIGNLPWPEEYMKGGYPKGLTEPSARELMNRHQEAIDETRDAARLRPAFAKAREVTLEITDTFDQPEFEDQSGNKHKAGKLIDIDLKDQDKNPLGSISVTTGEDFLHVDYAHNAEFQPWQHGMNQMEVLLKTARQLYTMFPETKGLGGYLLSRDKYVKYTWDQLFGTKGAELSLADVGLALDPVEMKPGQATGTFMSPGPEGKRFNTKAVASSTVGDVLGQIDFSRGIGGPLLGALDSFAKAISEKAGTAKIHIIADAEWDAIREGRPIEAQYDPISHTIMMPERSFNSPARDYYLLHEATHAATVRELARDDKLRDKIETLRQHIQDVVDPKYKDRYGFRDTDEFIAEAISNPDFQTILAGTKISPEMAKALGVREPGLIKTMWDTLIKLIADGLGIGDNPDTVSALEAALKVTQEAFDRQLGLKDRFHMRTWAKDLAARESAPGVTKGAVSSMKQLELVRSLARLEDNILKQVGDGYSIGEIRNALSGFGKRLDNERILTAIDRDDAKNYMKYLDNITSEAKSSLQDYQREHKKAVEGQLAEHRPDPFKKAFDAIDEFKSMAQETESPPIVPMRPEPPARSSGAKQPELPGLTRMEDRKAFATPTALNINKEWYQKYQDLIAKQQGEDAKRKMEVALKRAEQIQTKEWQEASERISKEVESQVRARPDVAVDEALRKGTLGEGTAQKGGRRLRLNAEELTEEQKGVLDKSEYSTDGIHPDDLANYFGYPSGDAMLERLGQFREFVKQTYASSEAFVKAAVREETAKRMEQEFGDLGANILAEARDHVTSETQLDLMHEELVGLAMQAGMEFSITKAQMKAVAKTAFDKHTMGTMSMAEYLRLAGKHGLELEKAMLDQDYKTAFKAKQMQTLATMMAAEAKKVEKANKVWDRNAKRFSKRKVSGIDQRYTNAIHDIMFRTDATPKPRRTAADLADAFRRDGWSDISPLRDFVADRMEAFRELAVPEWLQDPRFQKDFDKLTTKEFMEAHDAMRSLIKNGRDEQRVFSQGESADLVEVFDGMREQIRDLPVQEDRIDKPENRIKKWIGTAFWAHVNLESMMNRLDRGNIRGLFKKYIMRPITEASNAKDAMMKKYQGQVADLGKIKDMDKLVENTLFIDPRGDGKPFIMRKRNVLGVLQNVGNKSNLEKLAKGYDVDPQHIMDWLKRNTTKEDWDRAQKIGDIFEDLFEQGSRMQHELTGIAPVKVPLESFVDPHGVTRRGWYNPVKYDRKRPGDSRKLMGRSALEDEGYFRATTPTGFLEERTGYAAPMELNLDIVPVRMRQMIHDITMRPSIIQATKFFYNPEFNRMVRKYYGDKPVEEFVPFLRDVANSPNFVSFAEQTGNQAMEFFRQNLITTLIGLNPGTVMKHGTTALLNSLQQMGYRDFAVEFGHLVKDLPTGRQNWKMAMEKSEELQRRRRNFSELIAGHGSEINIRGGKGGGTFDTAREVMMQFGATPVAASDLLSSVPTWLVAYKRAIMAGESEGEAIYRGDLAVRQTHGSSVMSNKPSIMRGNAFTALYSSLYGFFSHMFQKQYEMAWKAKDAMGLAKEGEKLEAAKRIPELASLFLSYVILPAVIEELVTPYTNSERDSWGKKIAKTLVYGISSSTIGARDFIHGFIGGRDQQVGLMGTMFQLISNVGKDLGKGAQTFTDPARQAKFANHVLTMFGLLTGLTNASEGKMAEYAWRVNKGLEKPKGPWELLTGARYGTTKGHSKTANQYLQSLKGH